MIKKIKFSIPTNDEVTLKAVDIARQQSSRGERSVLMKIFWTDLARVMSFPFDLTVQNALQTIMQKMLINEKKQAIYYPRGGIYRNETKLLGFYFSSEKRSSELEAFEIRKFKKSTSQLKIYFDGQLRFTSELWPETTAIGVLTQLGAEISNSFVLATMKPVTLLELDSVLPANVTEVMLCKVYQHLSSDDETPDEPLNYVPTLDEAKKIGSDKKKIKNQDQQKQIAEEIPRCQPPPNWFLSSKDGEFESPIMQGVKLKVVLKPNTIIGTSKTGASVILAGTIDAILIYLLDSIKLNTTIGTEGIPGMVESPETEKAIELIRVFIYTYKKFSSPTYVLGLLRGLWEQAGNEIKKLQRRSAICYFLEQWFESQFVDFELGPIMAITQHWIKSMAPEHTTFLLPKLLSLEQILNGRNATKSLFSEVLPSMETKKGLLGKGLSLRDLDPEDVAHYYTLLDVEGMQATTIEEFWDIFPDNNFQKLIERGKRFSLWVASEIVKEADPVRRVEVMYFVLKVASCMLELNNMNGVMWTWLGLNHKALEKLNQTREKLPTAAKEIYSQVSKLCTFQKVLKEVTLTELKKVKDEKLKFVIPWFKSFERAFTNIEISYNDVVLHPEAGLPLLNYEKMFQYAQQINSFSQYQALLYPLAIKKSYTQNEAVLKEFLMGLPVLAEAEIGALVDSLE